MREGVARNNQVVPWAPWEMKKSDLDSEKITEIIKRPRQTGKLIFNGAIQRISPSSFGTCKIKTFTSPRSTECTPNKQASFWALGYLREFRWTR